MPSEPTLPALIKHHGYRSWTSTYRDDDGHKRTKRFGREGEITERQAKALFTHWRQTEWYTTPATSPPSAGRSVTSVAATYLRHAGRVYRKHGRTTRSIDAIVYGLRALRDAYGGQPADSLDNPKLSALRDKMITGASGRPLSISTVNGRLEAIKSAYKYAREKGWISAATLADVLAVARLTRRSAAKAPVPVLPVHPDTVARTIAVMPATLQALIRFLALTGARPGEACILRPRDLDTTGVVWVYTPAEHKTEHMDGTRRVCIGPKAQAVLAPLLSRDLAAYVFSPKEAHAERLRMKREARKTPHYPSSMSRDVAQPTARLGVRYTTETLRRAIHYACKLAGVDQWNPNQLRHAHATRVFKELGLNEASKALGHTDLDTTLIYAERDLDIAKGVALKLG